MNTPISMVNRLIRFDFKNAPTFFMTPFLIINTQNANTLMILECKSL